MKRIKIGMIFGSRSVEHEVSIITAHQVIEAADRSKYEIVPIYITKEGQWCTGKGLLKIKSFKEFSIADPGIEAVFLAPDPLFKNTMGSKVRKSGFMNLFTRGGSIPSLPDLDVAFPLVHGTYGEEGTLQGLLELADIPYIGSGVLGSALGMDKICMKALFKENGLSVMKYIWFLRSEWESKREDIISHIELVLNYPLFVKPSNLGSSIGISKAKDREGLIKAIDIAACYDRRILIEESLEGCIEINCSVIGYEDPVASVCEQPVSWEDFLNYDEKYLRGGKNEGLKGAERRIPAPVPESLTKSIQRAAVSAFRSFDCRGVARIDFLVNKEKSEFFVNEINTIPGSVSFYLWEAGGLKFGDLIDKLVGLALDVHKDKKRNMYSYNSGVIEKMTSSLKAGGNGAKL